MDLIQAFNILVLGSAYCYIRLRMSYIQSMVKRTFCLENFSGISILRIFIITCVEELINVNGHEYNMFVYSHPRPQCVYPIL